MRRLVTQEYMKSFAKAGVPYSVLLAPTPDDIERRLSLIEIPRGRTTSSSDVVIHDKEKQSKALEGFKQVLLKDDLRSKGKLMIFSSRDMDYLPNQLALNLAVYAVENGKKFHWHSVYGGTRDDLRDDPALAKTQMGGCALLIISNLAENSTAMKVEKARDLLTQHSEMNRIVVTAGINPVEYAKDVLRCRADSYLYF